MLRRFSRNRILIDENHIVTVAHVVDEAQEIIAYVDDEIAIAEVVAIDLDRDLALLRTDIPVGSYYFSLGDFEYRTGDQISVIGFPLGLDLSLTVGTISNAEVFGFPTFADVHADRCSCESGEQWRTGVER